MEWGICTEKHFVLKTKTMEKDHYRQKQALHQPLAIWQNGLAAAAQKTSALASASRGGRKMP